MRKTYTDDEKFAILDKLHDELLSDKSVSDACSKIGGVW